MAIDPEKIKHLFGINLTKNEEVEETDEEYQTDEITAKKSSFDDRVNDLKERLDILGTNNDKKEFSKSEKNLVETSQKKDNIEIEKQDNKNNNTQIEQTKPDKETRPDNMDIATNTIKTPTDVKNLIQDSLQNPLASTDNFDSVEEELPQIEVPIQTEPSVKEEPVKEPEEDLLKPNEEIKEEEKQEQEEIKEEKPVEIPVEIPVQNTPVTINYNKNDSGWTLNSPSPKFDSFYSQKSKLIERITPGGPINFTHFRSELRMAKVDVTIPIFDTKKIVERMQEVQKWRERLQEIQININAQYYLWRRGIDLMRGLLARAEYDKPVIKQEGVIYEHMQDMELYFSDLEAIKADSMAVDENLRSSFDCLSRQLTISYSTRDAHNFYSQPRQQYQQSEQINSVIENHSVPEEKLAKKSTESFNLEGFDTINDTESIKTSGPKKVNWGD